MLLLRCIETDEMEVEGMKRRFRQKDRKTNHFKKLYELKKTRNFHMKQRKPSF